MATASISLADYDFDTLSARFAEDGAVTMPPVLTEDDLAEIRHNIDRYCRFVVPKLPETIRAKTVRFETDGVSIRSCYYMDQGDDYFLELGNRPFFKDLVSRVARYDVELYVVETFNKYANVGSAAPVHQDCAYLPLDPMDMVHLWIAVDPATSENGALRYWKGSQKGGLAPHVPAHMGLKVDPDYLAAVPEDLLIAELPAGSASIHSGLVIHDSPPNVSEQPRLGLLCGYRGAHTRFVRDED